jgi:hypothetical protein
LDIRQQLTAIPVLDKPVRNSNSGNASRVQPQVVRSLKHGAAKAAHQHRFLDGYHKETFLNCPLQDRSIKWLDESGTDDSDIESLLA